MLSAIGQIACTVRDLNRAVLFYRDTLGLPYLFSAGNMAFFDCAGVRLMLGTGEKPNEQYNSVLYFRTADIQAARRDLAARGVSFEGEPHLIAKMPDHDLWMAFFLDTEGNLLALMSEVREARVESVSG
jgi:methylmalonyl-CoA/ethylmalonyl-CoA epimerase